MATVLNNYSKNIGISPRDINGDIRATAKVVGTTSALADQVLIASDTNGSSYYAAPHLFRMKDDRILLTYWRGAGHISNLGAIYGKIVDNDFVTLVDEFVVADDDQPYDTRNRVIVQTDCGNFTAFYRLYDAVGASTLATKMITSSDGINWSVPVDATNIFSGVWTSADATSLVVPYGTAVKTSNGYMQTFYNRYEAGVLFSTDGVNWGNPKQLYLTASYEYAEPFLVKIDDDRIVVIHRCQNNQNSYIYQKTSDGGITWTAVSVPYASSATATTAAAPMSAIPLNNGEIAFSWALRKPVSELVYNTEDAEAFWTSPETAWAVGRPNRQVIATSSANTAINFGYQALLRRYDNSVMVAWYDEASTGLEDDTDIRIRTVNN